VALWFLYFALRRPRRDPSNFERMLTDSAR
jgi:hypothetical protein